MVKSTSNSPIVNYDGQGRGLLGGQPGGHVALNSGVAGAWLTWVTWCSTVVT